MTGRRWLRAFAVVAAGVALAYAGFRTYRGSQAEQCYACQRAIHAHSRTLAVDKGRVRVFCCPACALSEHEQEGKPIRVTELTDFLTGAKLAPSGAFILKGSDVNMCAHTQELIDAEKRPAGLQYDRCSPSLLAFGSRNEAMEFARTHGGEVVPFTEIVSAFSREESPEEGLRRQEARATYCGAALLVCLLRIERPGTIIPIVYRQCYNRSPGP